jgi:hypothetical protein
METQTLHDVPKSELKNTVDDFKSDGYTVTTQEQDNGKFTVVATRPTTPATNAAGTPSGGDTVVLHNVKAEDRPQTVQDLTDEGYTVTVQPEPDGEFTVIGVKTS